MRKMIAFLLASAMSMGLAACGTDNSAGNSDTDTSESRTEAPAIEDGGISGTDSAPAHNDEQTAGSNVLIAYFSVPEDVDTVDAVAGASIMVKDGEKLGSTEYVTKVIQQTVGGDLFRIETVENYPLDHDPLVDQAADEQDAPLHYPRWKPCLQHGQYHF